MIRPSQESAYSVGIARLTECATCSILTSCEPPASVLLDEVKKGREVVITEHGRPVAKLVPLERPRGKGVPNFAALRRRMPVFDPPLSATLDEDREDRL